MKEFTTEQKAQRYDEALKYAKIYYKEGNEDMKMMMKTCFPVLVEESEDEKIRGEIYENIRINNPKEFADRYIAWIEAQCEHANFRNAIQVGDHVTRNRDGVLVNLSQLNRVAKKDEKQGEQNIVWGEEDEACAYLILRELEQDKEDSPDYSKHFTRLIDWFTTRFKLLRPQGRWKPSEIQLETLKELSHDFPTKRGTIEEILKHLK